MSDEKFLMQVADLGRNEKIPQAQRPAQCPHWVISRKSLASERYDRLIAYLEWVLITITTTATLVMCAMLNARRPGFIQRCEQLYSHHSAYFRGRL